MHIMGSPQEHITPFGDSSWGDQMMWVSRLFVAKLGVESELLIETQLLLLTTYTQAWVDLRPLVSITILIIIINQHLGYKTLSHYFDNLHKSAVADWLLCWEMIWITHSHTTAGQKKSTSTATSQVYLSPCNSSLSAYVVLYTQSGNEWA